MIVWLWYNDDMVMVRLTEILAPRTVQDQLPWEQEFAQSRTLAFQFLWSVKLIRCA